jgi:allene oxide cyclase
MRKLIVLSAAAAVLGAAAITGTAIASASPRSGPSRHPAQFTVVEHAVTDTVADTGPSGDSLGDVLAFANPVFDAENIRAVGSDNGSCVRTKVGASFECSWTTTLKGGSIVVEGPFFDTSDSTLAVIGGTGVWQRATGQMKLHARDAQGSEFDFVFTVQRR